MTDAPLADTWHSRDLPVLREVVRLSDETLGRTVKVGTLVANLGMGGDDVQRAALALLSDGLVAVIGGSLQVPVQQISTPSGEARRLAGAWPTPETALDRMIAALEQIAEHADDQDTQTRAQKVLDALRDGATTIGLSVATAAITGQLPGQ